MFFRKYCEFFRTPILKNICERLLLLSCIQLPYFFLQNKWCLYRRQKGKNTNLKTGVTRKQSTSNFPWYAHACHLHHCEVLLSAKFTFVVVMHPGFLKKDLSTFTIRKTDSNDIVAHTLQVSQAPFSVVQTSFQRFFFFPSLGMENDTDWYQKSKAVIKKQR